jgi:hypothetical protein|tara:strand:- start:240 stop:371 length:132 start_codon:yes stop_codon:yes gene_type:complete
MKITFANGDTYYFPNLQETEIIEETPLEPQWIRDSKGNWIRES